VLFIQSHIDPSVVLLVPCLVGIPGALLQESNVDLMVDVLLLEHLLVRELDLAVQVLKSCGLAKAEELVVDGAIMEVVKLVNVLHNFLTLSLYKVVDKRICANGNPNAASCASAAEIPLTRILVLCRGCAPKYDVC
jgi:hypothetical protein